MLARRTFQLLGWAFARSPGSRLAGVGGVDFLLDRGQAVTAGVRIKASTPLRDGYVRATALVAGVGDRAHSGGVDRVEETMLASGAMSCRAPG